MLKHQIHLNRIFNYHNFKRPSGPLNRFRAQLNRFVVQSSEETEKGFTVLKVK